MEGLSLDLGLDLGLDLSLGEGEPTWESRATQSQLLGSHIPVDVWKPTSLSKQMTKKLKIKKLKNFKNLTL